MEAENDNKVNIEISIAVKTTDVFSNKLITDEFSLTNALEKQTIGLFYRKL